MEDKRHYVALDGLRGIAALSVAILHSAEAHVGLIGPNHAQLAVDFFFLLSGFVMGFAYDARLRAGMTVRHFVAIRLVRLYPMVVLGVALGVVARFAMGDAGVASILGAACFALAMLPLPRRSPVPVSAFPLNGPLWSLSFELLSNIVYAMVATWLTTRRLALATALLALMLLAVGLVHGRLDMGVAWAPSTLMGLIRVFAPFALGMLVFRLAPARAKSVPGGGLLAALLLVAASWTPFGGGLYEVAVVLLLFPLVLLLGIGARDDGALRSTWAWLGAISYPLYAINQPIFRLVNTLVPGMDAGYQAVVGLLTCILLADLLRRLYDEPVRRWLRQKLPSSRRRWAPTVADASAG